MRSSSTATRSKSEPRPDLRASRLRRHGRADRRCETGRRKAFIYISGAAADENATHPGFRAKGRAERAIRESGLTYTIFRPSLVYGPEDKVVNGFARALRFAPVFGVPGTGRQKVQPVLVDDLAACVDPRRVGPRPQRDLRYRRPGSHDVRRDDAHHHGRERTSPPAVSHSRRHHARRRRRRSEKLPKPVLSRDAVTFVTADNAADIKPLIDEFGINLTPSRVGMAYLAKK